MSIDISDSGSASGSSFEDDGGPQFMGAGAAWGGMPDAADPYAIPLSAPSTRTFTPGGSALGAVGGRGAGRGFAIGRGAGRMIQTSGRGGVGRGRAAGRGVPATSTAKKASPLDRLSKYSNPRPVSQQHESLDDFLNDSDDDRPRPARQVPAAAPKPAARLPQSAAAPSQPAIEMDDSDDSAQLIDSDEISAHAPQVNRAAVDTGDSAMSESRVSEDSVSIDVGDSVDERVAAQVEDRRKEAEAAAVTEKRKTEEKAAKARAEEERRKAAEEKRRRKEAAEKAQASEMAQREREAAARIAHEQQQQQQQQQLQLHTQKEATQREKEQRGKELEAHRQKQAAPQKEERGNLEVAKSQVKSNDRDRSMASISMASEDVDSIERSSIDASASVSRSAPQLRQAHAAVSGTYDEDFDSEEDVQSSQSSNSKLDDSSIAQSSFPGASSSAVELRSSCAAESMSLRPHVAEQPTRVPTSRRVSLEGGTARRDVPCVCHVAVQATPPADASTQCDDTDFPDVSSRPQSAPDPSSTYGAYPVMGAMPWGQPPSPFMAHPMMTPWGCVPFSMPRMDLFAPPPRKAWVSGAAPREQRGEPQQAADDAVRVGAPEWMGRPGSASSAMSMVDDIYLDQLRQLRLAAARHRQLLAESFVPRGGAARYTTFRDASKLAARAAACVDRSASVASSPSPALGDPCPV
mmetsp:Transcript_23474/g.51669  ORF Transcript_23474/g.51669 Transcript_23474/m.51669 type:complete len:691 (-) Transcript_23474:84-2156(-)|eukprot:CAMPEP_0204254996 /NCGR_PEP_ID=MMETSP0468-20130131/2918_1 /ASSEMBLY_ACC=CAM_ASM_000383 /TAXON_ID=2969 /ORGANISM="Oxyrrhis marina" /LENGTH=690 /DNA_ID=CAMNT_0051228821 /DNA_START=21 /DNA_END=2093 /DNA_ORIENTATION=-